MRKIIQVIVCSIFAYSLCFGQNSDMPKYNKMVLLPDQNNITPRFWYLNDSIIKDTSKIAVYYELNYRLANRYYKTVVVNEFGNNWSQYYSLAHRFANVVQTRVHNQMAQQPIAPGVGVNYQYSNEERALQRFAGDNGYMDYEIWIDNRREILYEKHPDFLKNDVAYEYQEHLPDFKWSIIQSCDTTICGYKTIAASCVFRGRKWIAWYAPQIPIHSGPWKFNGLPGLILKISDQLGDYSWESVTIKQAKTPMSYYKIKTIKLRRDQYNKWLSNIYKSPYISIVGINCQALVLTAEDKILDESWTIPYNPLELE